MDGTEENQDVTSGEGQETSRSYTEAEVVEIKRKADSDVKAATGRAMAEATKATKIANDAIANLKKAEDRAYDEAREKFRDQPNELSNLDARRRERETQVKLDEAEDKLREATERLEESDRVSQATQKKDNARDIAAKTGVDPKLLARVAELTDGSVEAIEAEAKMLPQVSEPRATLLTDSGKGSNTGQLTVESIENMSPAEYAKNRDKIFEALRGRQI